jgi:hypothetical protein
MAISATLEYFVTPQGPVSLAAMEAALAAVNLAQQEADLTTVTGALLTSDSTTTVGSQAVRTIVYDLTPAQFVLEFPVGTDQASPFRGVFEQTISSALSAVVKEVLVLV